MNRHDFSAVLVIFPILKHLLVLKPDFEKIIESCDYNVRTQFSNVLNTLQITVNLFSCNFMRTENYSRFPHTFILI